MARFSYRRWLYRSIRDFLLVLVGYTIAAYIIVPGIVRHYEHQPTFAYEPKTTQSILGLPGDPLNVALVGTKEELIRAMAQAGWSPADPITLRSTFSIAASIIFNRAYPNAPVSNLYLWDRKQDLAFELSATDSARQRHHVRLWESDIRGKDGRPLWIGAATFDASVGFNRFTGQITHHIAPGIDDERDSLIKNLTSVGQLQQIYQVTGVGTNIFGLNASGDWYYTDGELTVGVIPGNNVARLAGPEKLRNPTAVDWKNQGWAVLRTLLRSTTETLVQRN